MAHAVEIAGVEKRDAGVERGMDRGDALLPVRWTIRPRHAHAAEAEGGDLRTSGPELTLFHAMSSLSGYRTSWSGRQNYEGWRFVR